MCGIQEGAQRSIEPIKPRNHPPPPLLAPEGGSNTSTLTGSKNESGRKELLSFSGRAAKEQATDRTRIGSSQDVTGNTTQHSKLDPNTN